MSIMGTSALNCPYRQKVKNNVFRMSAMFNITIGSYR